MLVSSKTCRFPAILFLQLKPADLKRAKEHGNDLDHLVTSSVRIMMSGVDRMQTPRY